MNVAPRPKRMNVVLEDHDACPDKTLWIPVEQLNVAMTQRSTFLLMLATTNVATSATAKEIMHCTIMYHDMHGHETRKTSDLLRME